MIYWSQMVVKLYYLKQHAATEFQRNSFIRLTQFYPLHPGQTVTARIRGPTLPSSIPTWQRLCLDSGRTASWLRPGPRVSATSLCSRGGRWSPGLPFLQTRAGRSEWVREDRFFCLKPSAYISLPQTQVSCGGFNDSFLLEGCLISGV